ncbi:MAG: VWA domain-containing protein [Pyrinomonadaceae bacterium]
MKSHLIIVLLLIFASLSLGQTPSASPSPVQSVSPEKPRTKTFGSSLKKYKNNGQRYFQANRKSNEPNDDETIQIKTDLVVSDVLVTDQNGNIITGLKKDDFIVMENGVPQTIEMFSSGENASIPRSIVLVIDYGGYQFPYHSIEAAKLLVDKLSPQDKMAIITDDVKLLVDFTTDKTLLKKTLDSFEKRGLKVWSDKISRSGGKNNQFSALLAVLNEMFTAEDRQRIIIFQGDGSEISTLKPDNDTPYQISKATKEKSRIRYESERDFGFSDIKEAVERSRATIYSIIPGIRFLGFSKEERLARAKISLENFNRAIGVTDYFERARLVREFQAAQAERELAAQTAMFKVAELSGGKTGFIEKPEDAETVYSAIFNLISNRYAIGYYPTNQEQDGKLREVKIEVREHPEYVVTGRKVYFPQ